MMKKSVAHDELLGRLLQSLVGAASLYRHHPDLPEASLVLEKALVVARTTLLKPGSEPGIDSARGRVLACATGSLMPLQLDGMGRGADRPNRARAAELCGLLMDVASVLMPILAARTPKGQPRHGRG